MRNLTPTENILFITGGLLMVIGAALPIFLSTFALPCCLFAAGAALFSGMQLRQTYSGSNFTLKRLRQIQIMADLLFIITAILMFTRWQQLPPCRADEWKISLAIATFLELYTGFRIPSELEKEENRKKK